MSNRDYASKQLNKIRNRIAEVANRVGRDAHEVTLVGAAKQQTPQLVDAFRWAGLQHVGENYLNQAIEKQELLGTESLTWHFIGHIQSNKTRAIAESFSWVQGVDRLKIATRLDMHTPESKTLQTLLQLNIDDESGKGGISVTEAPELCLRVSDLARLRLRGFMLLPRPRQGFDEQRKPFRSARKLLEQCNQRYGLAMDTLSMGMSNDLEAAIAEGSTMVRIGTDLFGARAK